MSVLIDSSVTIYEVIQNIKDGKYVMPAFQRQYVWSMEQIEKLWDSILLDYPIATFLFWHVDDDNVTFVVIRDQMNRQINTWFQKSHNNRGFQKCSTVNRDISVNSHFLQTSMI